MKVDPHLLNTLSASRTHGNTPSSTPELHTKMSTLWKSRNTMKEIQNYQAKNIPHISEDKIAKIQSFITEFKHQDSDKTRFALVFKTLVSLNRYDKESFITQTVETLKSSSESDPDLYKDFTKSLQRYMSISLMNTPFTEQMNKNMTSFSLEGDDDDD